MMSVSQKFLRLALPGVQLLVSFGVFLGSSALGQSTNDPALDEFYARQERGAVQGHPRDQYLLGVRYLKGDGVAQDNQRALTWIRAAVTNQNKEFPLSPGFRKEAEGILNVLEGRNPTADVTDLAARRTVERGATLSFKDRSGRQYKDIEVVIIEPNGIVYLEPDRIHAGQVRFVEMPESVRDRFGYDPTDAEKYEQQQQQQARVAAQRAVIEQQLQDARSAGQRAQDESHPTLPLIRTGTGFFVTDDGYLLTCFHVVKGAMNVGVKAGQVVLPAQLMATDTINDIALLKVPGTFHALHFAASSGPSLGDSVFTVGFPNVTLQGFEPKLTKGEISSLAGMRDDPHQFQHSVAVQPGNSGGALVDANGNVVGLLTGRLSEVAALQTSGMLPQSVNYALKSETVTAFLAGIPEVTDRLKASGREQDRKSDELQKDRKFDEMVKQVRDASVLVVAGP
jgi:S1-C subfamily serine protease